MKKILIILLAMIPLLGIAQQNNTTKEKTNTLQGNVPGIASLKDSTEGFWIKINCGCKLDTIVKALVFVNNIPLKKGQSIYKIDSNDIQDFSVIKDKELLAQYGEKGKYGVIKIEVKDLKKYEELLQEEYETLVFAPGFETFLASQPSKNLFTESSLKEKNALLVNEWNLRHRDPIRYDANIYETAIEYDRNTDYGMDVEYTLYMFFRFMEKENNMSLSLAAR